MDFTNDLRRTADKAEKAAKRAVDLAARIRKAADTLREAVPTAEMLAKEAEAAAETAKKQLADADEDKKDEADRQAAEADAKAKSARANAKDLADKAKVATTKAEEFEIKAEEANRAFVLADLDAEAVEGRTPETLLDLQARIDQIPDVESAESIVLALKGEEREIPKLFIDLLTDRAFKVGRTALPQTATARNIASVRAKQAADARATALKSEEDAVIAERAAVKAEKDAENARKSRKGGDPAAELAAAKARLEAMTKADIAAAAKANAIDAARSAALAAGAPTVEGAIATVAEEGGLAYNGGNGPDEQPDVKAYPDFLRSQYLKDDQWRYVTDWKEEAGRPLFVATGTPYAYSVSPLEKSQLLSTNAKAARSMEMALSAVASLQTMGPPGGLDLAYVRESAGIAEAFENKPIVIGFADRQSPVEREQLGTRDPTYVATHQAPQVCWVFGPKVQMNPEKSELKLVHGFAAHDVSADLSIPGWWPHVRAILETAWIGNLHNTGRAIRLDDETGQGFHRERFTMKLPVNAADLDGLTAYLARYTTGTLLPTIKIYHVEPLFLSACTKEVEILIEGANVWRSTRAYLGGVEAEEVRVLPDMEGIAARFSMDKLFATPNASMAGLGLEQGVRLTVWTRNGTDSKTLNLEGSRVPGKDDDRGSYISRNIAAATTAGDNLAIVGVTPSQICNSATSGTLLVKAFGPGKANFRDPIPTALLQNGNVRSVTTLGSGGRNSRVYRIEFDGGPFGAAGRNLEFSLSDGEDIARAPIRLVDCTTAPVAKPRRASVAGTRTIAEKLNNNLKFEIGIKGLDPALDNNSLRIAVLPILPAGGVDKYTVPVQLEPVTGTDNTYKADITVTPGAPSYPDKAFNQPRRLRYVLLQELANNEYEKLGDVNGTIVYYPDKAKTKIGVSKPSEISRKRAGLTFSLPIFLEEAYPTLRNSKFVAEMKNHNDVALDVELDWGRAEAGSAPGTTDVPGTIRLANEASEQAWKKKEQGDHTFDLRIEGDDMPDIASFVFNKKEKPPEGDTTNQ